jgi:hypothetical protein
LVFVHPNLRQSAPFADRRAEGTFAGRWNQFNIAELQDFEYCHWAIDFAAFCGVCDQ